MENEEIKKLEEELAQTLKKSVEISQVRLEQDRVMLDKQTKDQIEIYSNDIRNISIISGTIAPFSLTLLGITQLNANFYLLITGFSLLLLNVVVAQYFIKKHSTDKDTKLVKAEFNWLMAEFELKDVANESLNSGQRVNKNFDYLKSIGESEKLLGVSAFNIEIQKVRAALRYHHRITNSIFSLGALCIILSVIVNPIFQGVSYLILHIFNK